MFILDRPYWLLISGTIGVLMTLLAAPILTSTLEAYGRGIAYTSIAFVSMFSALLSMGTSTTIRVVFSTQQGKLGPIFALQILFSGFILAVLGFAYFTLAAPNYESAGIWLLVGSGVFSIAAGNFGAILLAKHQYVSAAGIGIFVPAGQLLVAIFSETSDAESLITEIFLALFLSNFLAALLSLVLSQKFRVFSGSSTLSISLLASAKNLAPLSFQFLASRIDLLIAGFVLGSVFAGQYSLALMVAVPILIIQPALLSSYLQSHIESFSTQLSALGSQILSQIEKTLSLGLVVGFASALIGTLLVVPVFGSAFLEAAILGWFTCTVAIVGLVSYFSAELLVASNMGRNALQNLVTGLGSFFVIAPWAFQFGVPAFLMATASLYLVTAVLNLGSLGIPAHSLRPTPRKAYVAALEMLHKPA